uniref:Uncharacterized protein n=1 Tax=Leersia perrieri TaxID=77586 RepID=A0A0D9VGS8_9ORYZ
MGKTCRDVPCISMPDLGKGGAHCSNAHNLLFEEDILLVMNKEITREEAMHLLQEEWGEAKRQFDEKLDRLLEMFSAKEAKSEACEKIGGETSISIRATTTNDAETLPSTLAPPSSTPVKCLRDLPKVTHAKCLMLSFDVKCGTDQTMVMLQTRMEVFMDVPTSIQLMDPFSSRTKTGVKQDTPTPTKCSVKCSRQKNLDALMLVQGQVEWTYAKVVKTILVAAKEDGLFSGVELYKLFPAIVDEDIPETWSVTGAISLQRLSAKRNSYAVHASLASANYWPIMLFELTVYNGCNMDMMPSLIDDKNKFQVQQGMQFFTEASTFILGGAIKMVESFRQNWRCVILKTSQVRTGQVINVVQYDWNHSLHPHIRDQVFCLEGNQIHIKQKITTLVMDCESSTDFSKNIEGKRKCDMILNSEGNLQSVNAKEKVNVQLKNIKEELSHGIQEN